MKTFYKLLLSLLLVFSLSGCSQNDVEKDAPEGWVTSVVISINPQVRLYLNENDEVLKVMPLNDDGEKILANLHLEGEPLQNAANVICEEAANQGFIKDNSEITFQQEKTLDDNQDRVTELVTQTMHGVNVHLQDHAHCHVQIAFQKEKEEKKGLSLFKCKTCDGEKRIACTKCDSSSAITCTNCNGTKSTVCHECHGNKTVACYGCKGTGKTSEVASDCIHCHGTQVCQNCKGEGRTYAYGGKGTDHEHVIVGSEVCFQCKGNGRCFNCYAGKTCPHCSTRNINGKEVKNPYGIGIVECGNCQATGTETCNQCSPEGNIDCPECEDGYIDCPDCK